MKIAFLFLTIKDHKCPKIWELFFKNIPHELYNIYCHPKFIPDTYFLRNNIIQNRIDTRWGDISLVRASILLYNEAYKDITNKFFILLSDSCVPAVNFFTIYENLFKLNKNLISYKHLNNKLNRYRLLSPLMRDKLEFKYFYSQHQWMILKRNLVKIFISTDYTKHFAYLPASDEHYFICVLKLFKLLDKGDIINRKTTYCDWSNIKDMHPKIIKDINERLINQCHKNGLFFIRKISPSCLFCEKYIKNLTMEMRLKNSPK